MMLVIPLLLTIDGCKEENISNMKSIFESKNAANIDKAQTYLECCGTTNWRYFNGSVPVSCCSRSVEKCFSKFAYIDGCLFKISQVTRAPAIITSVAMILMILLELIGIAIAYGLLKSIALKEGNIDFRAMFKERLEQIHATLAKPFQEDGFASNFIEAIKKKTQSSDKLDENDEKSHDDKTLSTLPASLADFSEIRSTIMSVDLPPHI